MGVILAISKFIKLYEQNNRHLLVMIFIVMQVSLKIVHFTVLTQNMIFIEIVKKSSICVTKNCAFFELIEFYINYIIIANHVDHLSAASGLTAGSVQSQQTLGT